MMACSPEDAKPDKYEVCGQKNPATFLGIPRITDCNTIQVSLHSDLFYRRA